MNTKSFFSARRLGVVLSGALLLTLFGCVAEPGRSNVRVQASSGYRQPEVTVDDDYVYYPGYEVYYSSNRHSYVYRDGNNWVTRPAPPRVAVDVLRASPSVHVDFHDSPEQHHAAVIKSYPKNWKPANSSPAVREEGPKTERKDDKPNGNDGSKHERSDDDKQRN